MSNFKGLIYVIIILVFIVFLTKIYRNYTKISKDFDEKSLVLDSMYSFQLYSLSDSNFLKIIDCTSQYFELTKYIKDKDEECKDLYFNEEHDNKCGVVFFDEENGEIFVTIEIQTINYYNYYRFSNYKIFIFNNYQFYINLTKDNHPFFKKTDTVIYKNGLIPEYTEVFIYDPDFWRYSYTKKFQINFISLQHPDFWDTICLNNNVPYNVLRKN